MKGLTALVAIAAAAIPLVGAASAAADAGPFACTAPTDFISPANQLFAAADSPSGAPGSPTALASTGDLRYNAIGVNPMDNYLYGVSEPPSSRNPPHLLRFDNTGAVTDLGPIAGLDYGGTIQYITGAFDSSGTLWINTQHVDSSGNYTNPYAYAVNVATQTVTARLPFQDTSGNPINFQGNDWTYDFGYMWGLNQGKLEQVNLTSGVIRAVDVPAAAGYPLREFNAAFTNANSDMTFVSYSGDYIVRATVHPGPLTPDNVVSVTPFPWTPGSSSTQNDGASCMPADQLFSAAPTTFNSVEGQSATAPVATFSDPDTNAQSAEYNAWISWGDGSSSAGTVSGTGGNFTVSGTHTYTEEGPYPVQVTIWDATNSNNQATVQSSAQVADAPLNASCATPTTSLQNFNGNTTSFTDTDPGGMTSDYTATVNWGDSSSPTSGTVSNGTGSGPYTVSGSHTYAQTGVYTITTTIVDAGGSQVSTQGCQTTVYAFAPGGGSFVIGNKNSAKGTAVTFWGAQWWMLNSLTGGTAPAAFKGYALNPSAPACGQNWSTDPGNSSPPPNGPLPAYMGIIVSSHITQSGSQISGDTPHIVVIKTNGGYLPDPGHAGRGIVQAQVC